MFEVFSREEYEKNGVRVKYEVYDVTYDEDGYPLFLIRLSGEWVRISAKEFLTFNEVYHKHYI